MINRRVQITFPRQFSRPVCFNMKTLDGKLIRARGWYVDRTPRRFIAELGIDSITFIISTQICKQIGDSDTCCGWTIASIILGSSGVSYMRRLGGVLNVSRLNGVCRRPTPNEMQQDDCKVE